MTYRSILAPLAGDADDAELLAWSAALSQGFEARLDALFVRRSAESASDFLGAAFSTYGLDDVLDTLDRAAEEARDRARDAYEALTANLPSACAGEFRDRVGEPREILAGEARLADLIVAASPREGGNDRRSDQFEALVLGGARPVFAIPVGVAPSADFTHVAVAWDGGLEAARAVAAALPVLKMAKTVTVIRIGDEAEDLEPVADLARWLDGHGVEAAGRACPRAGRALGPAIVEEASALTPDLLVIGAYGHSRWPLKQLRGATSYVARHAPWPVLFTH